jgi:hypothetical protein
MRNDDAFGYFRHYLEESSRLIQRGARTVSSDLHVRRSILDELQRRHGPR